MAVYDPEVGLQTSLDAGYTRMFFISANGIVSVNINLRTRQVSGYPPAYDYDLSFSSSPVVGNIVCDVSLPEHYPCFLTLFLQIPSFQRENIRPQKVMGWLVSCSLLAWEVWDADCFVCRIWLLRLVLISRLCSSSRGYSLLKPLQREIHIVMTRNCGLPRLNVCHNWLIDNDFKQSDAFRLKLSETLV